MPKRGQRIVWVAASLSVLAMLNADAGTNPREGSTRWALNRDGERPQTRVAVTNVTAWPNLTRLPDGDIVALIYNQPSHGRRPGDVACWASTDQGESWTLQSVAAPRSTPEQNRMNVEVIFSEDEGRTWSEVHRVLDTRPESTDIGYPSNVMRDDGQILTAYYEGGRGGYFMGTVVWCPVRTREAR